MKEKLMNPEYRMLVLKRRMDRAYAWAIRKGYAPVQYMHDVIDNLLLHLATYHMNRPVTV